MEVNVDEEVKTIVDCYHRISQLLWRETIAAVQSVYQRRNDELSRVSANSNENGLHSAGTCCCCCCCCGCVGERTASAAPSVLARTPDQNKQSPSAAESRQRDTGPTLAEKDCAFEPVQAQQEQSDGLDANMNLQQFYPAQHPDSSSSSSMSTLLLSPAVPHAQLCKVPGDDGVPQTLELLAMDSISSNLTAHCGGAAVLPDIGRECVVPFVSCTDEPGQSALEPPPPSVLGASSMFDVLINTASSHLKDYMRVSPDGSDYLNARLPDQLRSEADHVEFLVRSGGGGGEPATGIGSTYSPSASLVFSEPIAVIPLEQASAQAPPMEIRLRKFKLVDPSPAPDEPAFPKTRVKKRRRCASKKSTHQRPKTT